MECVWNGWKAAHDNATHLTRLLDELKPGLYDLNQFEGWLDKGFGL